MRVASVDCSASSTASEMDVCRINATATDACPRTRAAAVVCHSLQAAIGSGSARLLQATDGGPAPLALSSPQGVQRTFCAATMTVHAAQVACASINGTDLGADVARSSVRLRAPSSLVCPGNASRLADCTMPQAVGCERSVSLACGLAWEFRLTDRTGREGRLEVRPSRTEPWSPVCRYGFNLEAGWAACRSLGYNPLEVSIDTNRYRSYSSYWSRRAWMSNVDCTGAQRLQHCRFTYALGSCSSRSAQVYVNCGVLPGWLIAIIVVASLVVGGSLLGAAAYGCWRMCRVPPPAHHGAAAQHGGVARAADAQQQIFEDIPAELLPMNDTAVAIYTADDDTATRHAVPEGSSEAADAPAVAAAAETHRQQRILAACVRGDDATVHDDVTFAYAARCTQGFREPVWVAADGRAARFVAWDVHAGVLAPFAVVVASVRDPADAARACDLARTVQVPHVARVFAAATTGALSPADAIAVTQQLGVATVGPGGALVCIYAQRTHPKRTLAELTARRGGAFALDEAAAQRVLVDVCDAVAAMAQHGIAPLRLDLATVWRASQSARTVIESLDYWSAHARRPDTALRALQSFVPELCTAARLQVHVRGCRSVAEVQRAVHKACRPARPAPPPPPPNTTEAVECPAVVRAECDICCQTVTSAAYNLHGVLCSRTEAHFVCAECIDMHLGVLLSENCIDWDCLQCPLGCAGRWDFNDFGALVPPPRLRDWRSVSESVTRQRAHAAAAAERDESREMANNATARKHVLAVRQLLRPSCPHCGLVFQSFSGCLAVVCAVRDDRGRVVAGCEKTFCGACATPTPCAAGHGHAFVKEGALLGMWRDWRLHRTKTYVDEHVASVGDAALLRLVLQGVRSDLEAVGVWPLPGYNDAGA